jgi:hypothetical protein
MFLTNFLSVHLRLIETPEHQTLLLNAHFYLVKISSVDDREVFKICLEYWTKVSAKARVLTEFGTNPINYSSFPNSTKKRNLPLLSAILIP